MEGSGLTSGDLALLNNNGFGNGDTGMWFILLLFMMFGGFNGGNRGNYVTQSEMTDGFNNSAVQSQLQNIALSSANNNYETAQLINNQTNQMIQMNAANQSNLLQGFNALNMSITNQTNQLSSKLDNLGFQMEQCCCSIKTKMLEQQIQEQQGIINAQNIQISNAAQTQQILGTTGRYVAWAGSGAQTLSNGSQG